MIDQFVENVLALNVVDRVHGSNVARIIMYTNHRIKTNPKNIKTP